MLNSVNRARSASVIPRTQAAFLHSTGMLRGPRSAMNLLYPATYPREAARASGLTVAAAAPSFASSMCARMKKSICALGSIRNPSCPIACGPK